LSREMLERAPQAAPADAAQHARTVERLREVLRTQDRLGLLDLLGVTAMALASKPRALHTETLALVAEDGELRAWLPAREFGDRNGNDSGFTPVVCMGAAGRALPGPHSLAASNEFALARVA
jgi:hypothetical protein